jgi:hypothetical protein
MMGMIMTDAPQNTIEIDDNYFDDYADDYCYDCQNMGTVNCYCGGDLCICENYGEIPCPACWGL